MTRPWHPVTLFIIAMVGRAAIERLEREGQYEYIGCRRDCINTWQSALSYRLAFGPDGA